MTYRILLVAHDAGIRITRGTILSRAGYHVTPTTNAETALAFLEDRPFDLIVVGRDSLPPLRPVDQQIRERYPDALILKVVDLASRERSYSSEITESAPERLLASINFMLATANMAGLPDANEITRLVAQGACIQS